MYKKLLSLDKRIMCIFFTCVRVYVYNIICRNGKLDYETQSTKNLIYLYNIQFIKPGKSFVLINTIAKVSRLYEKRDIIWSRIKALCTRFRTPFPSMHPKRFVAISRDATGSGTLCSANNNQNRIVLRSSITAAMQKRTCTYWLLAFESLRKIACTLLFFEKYLISLYVIHFKCYNKTTN